MEYQDKIIFEPIPNEPDLDKQYETLKKNVARDAEARRALEFIGAYVNRQLDHAERRLKVVDEEERPGYGRGLCQGYFDAMEEIATLVNNEYEIKYMEED